jgi:hypothetical protein
MISPDAIEKQTQKFQFESRLSRYYQPLTNLTLANLGRAFSFCFFAG